MNLLNYIIHYSDFLLNYMSYLDDAIHGDGIYCDDTNQIYWAVVSKGYSPKISQAFLNYKDIKIVQGHKLIDYYKVENIVIEKLKEYWNISNTNDVRECLESVILYGLTIRDDNIKETNNILSKRIIAVKESKNKKTFFVYPIYNSQVKFHGNFDLANNVKVINDKLLLRLLKTNDINLERNILNDISEYSFLLIKEKIWFTSSNYNKTIDLAQRAIDCLNFLDINKGRPFLLKDTDSNSVRASLIFKKKLYHLKKINVKENKDEIDIYKYKKWYKFFNEYINQVNRANNFMKSLYTSFYWINKAFQEENNSIAFLERWISIETLLELKPKKKSNSDSNREKEEYITSQLKRRVSYVCRNLKLGEDGFNNFILSINGFLDGNIIDNIQNKVETSYDDRSQLVHNGKRVEENYNNDPVSWLYSSDVLIKKLAREIFIELVQNCEYKYEKLNSTRELCNYIDKKVKEK